MRKYVSPEFVIIKFDLDDVICASSGSGGSGGSGDPIGSQTDNAYCGFNKFDTPLEGGWFW